MAKQNCNAMAFIMTAIVDPQLPCSSCWHAFISYAKQRRGENKALYH